MALLKARLILFSLTFLVVMGGAPGGALLAAARGDDGPAGIDVDHMDPTVDPAEDFYRYANGGWLDEAEIPEDDDEIDVFTEVRDRTRDQVDTVIEDLVTDPTLVAGSDAWTAARVWEQGVDMDAREEAGLGPIQPLLEQIAAIEDVDSLTDYQITATLYGFAGLVGLSVDQSFIDSNEYVVYADSPYLGLDAPYYYQDFAELEEMHDGYLVAVAAFLEETGVEPDDAAALARDVFDFEMRLGNEMYYVDESENLADVYETIAVDDLSDEVGVVDWDRYLASVGLGDAEALSTIEGRQFRAIDGIVGDTSWEVIRAYLANELFLRLGRTLDADVFDIYFTFVGPVYLGTDVPTPVEEQVTDRVSTMYADVIGQRYVEAYFPPEAKEAIEALVDDLLAAFRLRLEQNPWLSDEAREEAIEKLDAISVKVGYPDQWRTYGGYSIGRNYGESVLSAMAGETAVELQRFGQPVDRAEWPMPVQTVNAQYGWLNNEIVFPAGILQAPYFDVEADAAVNYGGIGAVIGHEITHGFDDDGSQFGSEGTLENWYTSEDTEAFDDLTGQVIDQYDEIEVLPDVFVSGDGTLGENIADMGGVQVAWDALQIHLDASDDQPGEIDGMTADQRFFIAWATVWRTEIREEALEYQVISDSHAPGEVRATQPIRNMPEFYEAFDIEEGDPMWLPEDERVVVW